MIRGVFFSSMNKRGQFFIFASVLLSVLLFTMAFTVNQVIANEPDKNFRNYADDVERESNYVLDYEVYTGIPSDKLDNFTDIIEADFKDREVAANFLFIYGNNTYMKIKNIGTEGISVKGNSGADSLVVKGSSGLASSKIRVSGFATVDVSQFQEENTEMVLEGSEIGDKVEIGFNDYVYTFPVSDANQVIFIIQKDFNDETFVEVR